VFSVAFALEGTLVVTSDLERTAFRRLCAECATLPARRIAEVAVDSAYTEHRSALEDGGEALNGGIAQAFQAATGAAHSSPRALAARYRQIAREVAAEGVSPLPGAEPMLDELRRLAVPQAILANGLSSVEHRKAQSLDFAGKVLVSEDIGAKKPDPRAFIALANALMLPAEAIWYVGSNLEVDINPAYDLGFNVVWVAGETEGPQPPFDSRFHRVRQIDEVLELIKEPYTRAMLGLRYIMHNALGWRPGHFVPGVEYGLGD
jgi:FMN phosphatase YigB (HAD superfamily)